MEREQLPEFKKILKAEQAGAGRALLQNRQNVGSEKIADVLEEIWHTADREPPRLTSAGAPAYSATSELYWSALRTTHSGPVCAAEPDRPETRPVRMRQRNYRVDRGGGLAIAAPPPKPWV